MQSEEFLKFDSMEEYFDTRNKKVESYQKKIEESFYIENIRKESIEKESIEKID